MNDSKTRRLPAGERLAVVVEQMIGLSQLEDWTGGVEPMAERDLGLPDDGPVAGDEDRNRARTA